MNDLKGKVAVVTGASKGGCAAPRWPAKARTCAFRKSYPDVMVVQPGQDRNGNDGTGSLDRPIQGRVFAQG